MTKLKNWRIQTTDDVCRLTLDKPGGSHNVLSAEVIAELDTALAEIEQAAPSAVIIRSAKPGGFIAGADVSEFSAIQSAREAEEMTARAHGVLNRLEALQMPSVALINGHCLGGGLELALACDYRVACDEPAVRLGLPEVMLGIHPGFGGSVRLIETIGAVAALDLMLSGRSVAPAVARRMGMVDFAVPTRQLESTARYVLRQKAPKSRAPFGDWKKLPTTLFGKLLAKLFIIAPARAALAAVLRKKVAARADPAHYPAPFRLLDLWRRHGGNRDQMLKAEQASVAQLIITPTSRNLVKVFFLREGLKKSAGGGAKMTGEPFERVHVIGAGVMGGDIAAWCALRGLRATVHDQNPQALADATRRAHRLFQRKLRSPRLVQRAMDRFQPDPGGYGARRADVIIEAIVEDAEAKIALFAELQKIARPDALLATNTSSIPLEILGNSLGNTKSAAGRLVGLHFFNPVAQMQLVEIIKGDKTHAKTVRRAAAFAGRIGRLPVPVKSCPGFLVNRILMPYLLEAVELVREGVAGAAVDRAATRFGMPMGPVTLADTVGLDICLHVAQILGESSGGEDGEDGEGGEVLELLRQKVQAGKLGKKSGEGFYPWVKGKPQKTGAEGNARTRASIQDRLIFRYLNEAVACLHEGIVEHPDHLDAGLVFGTGFAPFRGGPLCYIADQGKDNLLRKLNTLHEQHGERFKPVAGWKELDLDRKPEDAGG